ncbi:DUF2079 domain-containing protein [Micromonospora sp. LOL_023]|uniref:DUF2079 domain-containing protein n=1 Tax=Micromonospora sp. LOL_023 TaxID=3345418 RepID=UPI003A845356
MLFALYSSYTLVRHARMESNGFDLGIFDQAVRAYSQFRAPVSELKGPGFNVLGDHFHPALALLAPLYWIHPDPVTLLITQAALFAVAAVPVTALAIEVCGQRAGIAIGLAYGLSAGIQQSVRFDFHEIALAVPLIAFSVANLARRRWVPAVAWALPLMLVKEDQAIYVAALGGYLILQGKRALGVTIMSTAVLAAILSIFLIVPAFSPGGDYGYLQSGTLNEQGAIARLFTPLVKWGTIFSLLAPTLFIAIRSPLILLAAPTILARFWASNEGYWGTGFHYNSVLIPVIFVAFIDGLGRLDGATPPRLIERINISRQPWRFAAPAALAIAVVVTMSGQPLWQLTDFEQWRISPQIQAARATLAVIPDGADVAAANRLAPQLTARTTVYLFPDQPSDSLQPEWVAIKEDPDNWPVSSREHRIRASKLTEYGYQEVARGGGVIVLRLPPEMGRRGSATLGGGVEPGGDSRGPSIAQ